MHSAIVAVSAHNHHGLHQKEHTSGHLVEAARTVYYKPLTFFCSSLIHLLLSPHSFFSSSSSSSFRESISCGHVKCHRMEGGQISSVFCRQQVNNRYPGGDTLGCALFSHVELIAASHCPS
ncbi:hypothetical protein E2C01_044684 [Portunus trituberculatus]|uniref:Uncharacterized protein n=1 Tax=Portunus trituberculatus TaxID=210409 RepID=A0A5B7G002_PORTR|nr:hypothetical protein [Portunus trituberculatus]